MSEHRELAVEVVIDADDLLPQIRGRVVAANELVAAVGGRRENTAVLATRHQQSRRIGADQQDGT